MTDDLRQPQDKYVIRFPDGMRDRLKDEAATNKRSLNAEIIARLEHTLAEPSPDAHRDAVYAQLYPLLVEVVEAYQRGEKPKIAWKRKASPK